MTKFRIEDNKALWRHHDLSVIGVVGMLEGSLEEVRNKFVLDPAFEVAPVKKEIGRDFLGVVVPESPFRDITFDQDGSHEGAIVMYSLNEQESRNIMDQILRKVPFYPNNSVSQEFINTIGTAFCLEVCAYPMYEQIAGQLHTTREQAFSVIRYSNFLGRYKGLQSDKAIETALTKFNVRYSERHK